MSFLGGIGSFLFGGGSTAKNTFESTIKIAIEVYLTASSNCKSKITQQQGIDIEGNYGCNIEIDGAEWDQAVAVDTQCSMDVKDNVDIESKIRQSMQQAAEATAQMFQMGQADSENYVKATIDMGVKISRDFAQNCNQDILQYQGINISDNTCTSGQKITIKNLEWTEIINSAVKCMMNTDTMTKFSADWENKLNQYAKAKIENTLAPLFWAGAAIIIAIIVMIFGVGAGATNWKFLLVVLVILVVVVVGYFLLAWLLKSKFNKYWWPFQSPSDQKKQKDYNDRKDRYAYYMPNDVSESEYNTICTAAQKKICGTSDSFDGFIKDYFPNVPSDEDPKEVAFKVCSANCAGYASGGCPSVDSPDAWCKCYDVDFKGYDPQGEKCGGET